MAYTPNTWAKGDTISSAKLNHIEEGVRYADEYVDRIKDAIDELEAGSLSAVGAAEGTMPVADGEGAWEWKLNPVAEEVVDLKNALGELAENGHFSVAPETHYIATEDGQIINGSGLPVTTPSGKGNRGYHWLTAQELAQSIEIDTENYNYNLAYSNNGTKAGYTGWLEVSPIVFDTSITFTQVGINIKRKDDGVLSAEEFAETLHYTITEQHVGNLATKDFAVAKQQSTSDAGKTLIIGPDGTVIPGTPQVQISVDDTLSISGNAADAKVTGDIIKELAENGYYTESSAEDYYIELEAYGIRVDGTTDSNDKKAHIWLTSAQEALTLNFDASVYKYNLCYKNNGSVVQYTSWITTSPIEIDSTITHDQVGVTFTTLNSTSISGDDLGNILFSQSGGRTIGNLATKEYVVAKQQSAEDAGKTLVIAQDGTVIPGTP